MVPHRRADQAGLLLAVLCGQTLWWLDHYYAAQREDPHHVLGGGGPLWLLAIASRAKAQLSVKPRRWGIVREAAARAVVAARGR